MAYKETKRLMEEIGAERRAKMPPEQLAVLAESDAADKRAVETWNRAEDAEAAWTRYKLSLPKPERDALRRDRAKYDALARMFFSARDPEKLAAYAKMSVDELFAVMAEKDMAAFEKRGA